jgi:zinc transport system substrate-binding protein
MKRTKMAFAALVAVISCLLISGCVKKNEGFTVFTSFYPLYDFTEKIAGGKATVVNLVPAGTEPHDYELSTTDIKNLADADLLIVNGLGLESWIGSVESSLDVTVAYASEGITAMQVNGVDDPHIWLSPKRARAMMENIEKALSLADPDNASFYVENYEKYAVLLDAIDLKYGETLSASERKDIVVAHAAFGYLASDYSLNQIAIEGLSADSEPDAATLAEIIDYVNDNHVTTIFYEELVSPAVAESIASETGAATAVLNPLEGLTEAELAEGEDYFTVMAANLLALEVALNEA